MPPPRTRLRAQLPATATVSNPLDYTTPIWASGKTRPVFDTLFAQGHDAAVIVQDYPAPGLDESKPWYRNDTLSFIAAAQAQTAFRPRVCSTIPENLDAETRSFLVAAGVAPMQGVEECMARHRRRCLAWPPPCGDRGRARSAPAPGPARCRSRASSMKPMPRQRLAASGIAVPQSRTGSGAESPASRNSWATRWRSRWSAPGCRTRRKPAL